MKLLCARLAPKSLQYLTMVTKRVSALRGYPTQGTVLLDEMGELTCPVNRSCYMQLPDDNGLPAEQVRIARVISATRSNLQEDIRCGSLREGLYYRLDGVCLCLPPLRQHKKDIKGLVDFLLTVFQRGVSGYCRQRVHQGRALEKDKKSLPKSTDPTTYHHV